MFPTFTGSSRKPRQINLSGRRNNPQTKHIPGLSTQVPQHSSALLSAQQQRARREAERKEFEATQKIQSVWRGRRDIAERRLLWRIEWDNEYGQVFASRSVNGLKEATSAIRLFLGFFDRTWSSGNGRARIGPHHPGDDLERLTVLVQALTVDGRSSDISYFNVEEIDRQEFYTFHRLMAILLSTIPRLPSCITEPLQPLLKILHFIAEIPAVALSAVESTTFSATPLISPTYYQTLSILTRSLNSHQHAELPRLLLNCLLGPFTAFIPARIHYPGPSHITVYKAFARLYLTTPNLTELLGLEFVETLALKLDIGTLSNAILESLEEDSQIDVQDSRRIDGLPEQIGKISEGEKLWLFAYLVYFFRRRSVKVSPNISKDGCSYVKCVTLLLGSLARLVGSKLDVEDHEMGGSGSGTDSPQISGDYNDDSDFDGDEYAMKKSPFSPFIKEQLHSLIEQPPVLSILSGISSFTHFSTQSTGQGDGEEAQLLASYALTLLLVFPRKRQELRMWLYLASTADGVPVLSFLWQTVKGTKLFIDVSADVSAAVDSLKGKRPLRHRSDSGRWRTSSNHHQSQYHQFPGAHTGNQKNEETSEDGSDWRVILLFLELYSFLLIVMDDDDFFNAGKAGLVTSGNAISGGEGSRARDSAPPLKDVKDLTLFLKNMAFAMYWYAGEIMKQGQTANGTGVSTSAVTGEVDTVSEELEVAGVKGMNYHFVKGLITNLLRMLYLRDSRRKFLPQDHWLMTSQFDMRAFISAVVIEEENRHQLEAGDSQADESLYSAGQPLERMRRQQQRQQKNNYLAAVAPRLEILQHLPFFIPFTTRVQIFREFVSVDQRRRRGGHTDPDAWRAMISHRREEDSRTTLKKHHATIRRESVFDDAFTEFYPLGEGLKEPIQITFVDQFGAQEAGIDGGGVTKEFLTSVVKEAFVPERYNLFLENKHNMLYPNPTSIEQLRQNEKEAGSTPAEIDSSMANLLKRYEFLGRIVGKCLYEGILVDINFAGVFLLQWSYGRGSDSYRGISYKPGVNDLRDLDDELYQGLVMLKNYTGDVESDFALNFTIASSLTLANGRSKTVTRDLKPNGSNIPVTNSTRLEYIHLVSKYRLLIQPRLQLNAFLHGLGSIIKPSWLSMFNQSELQTLVGGGDSPIDVADLRRNTVYGGLYVIGNDGREHPVVQNFWKVMEEDLTDVERRKLLKFVTSVSRAPLLGFGMLNPKFSIRDSGADQERLPSSSTCVNLLKLPQYKDRETLRKKLTYAANAGAGFDLS